MIHTFFSFLFMIETGSRPQAARTSYDLQREEAEIEDEAKVAE